MIQYWKDKGISVSRMPMVNRALPKGVTARDTLNDEEKKRLREGCINKEELALHTASPVRKHDFNKPADNSDGKKFDKMMFIQKCIPKRDTKVYETIINILDFHDTSEMGVIYADFIDVFGHQGDMLYKKIAKKIKAYKEI